MAISHQIRKASTAFSSDPPRRAVRGKRADRNDVHRRWIKTLPSLITGEVGNVDPAHISMADPSAGKPGRGKGKKVDDCWVVPLSRALHDEIGNIGERNFQRKYKVDLVRIAMALFINTGDDMAAALIIKSAKRGAVNEK